MLQKWQNVNEFHKGLQYKKTLHVNVHMYQQQYIITFFYQWKLNTFLFSTKKPAFKLEENPVKWKNHVTSV